MASASLVIAVLAGCTPGGDSATRGPLPSAAPTTLSPTEAVAIRPERGACYRLSLAEALAPTSEEPPVRCARRWTARTIHVGLLDSVATGHLLAVDSTWAEQAMARECPRRLAGYLGGSARRLRLTVFRSVWFTPTVAQSDAGADWFRCDLVALTRPDELARLRGNLKGALGDPERSAPYALCGTSAPDAPEFERVSCAEDHSWRAVGSVDLEGPTYPGARGARSAGEQRCLEEARQVAADALDFRWGFEWPTRAQWHGTGASAGQRYGVCWAPADGS